MNRDEKAAVVEELAEQIRSADAIFAVDYRGISVSDAAELRAKLRDAGTRFRIVKNSLTERASDAAGVDSLKSLLEGPTALAFVGGDAALAAKALNDAARSLGTLEFKGGLMDGTSLSADEIKSIARLPAREVLHGQLVGTIAAPLSGLVRTLNALISGLAIQLGQIAEQGLVSGEAPSPAAPAGSETDGEADASSPSAAGEDASPSETAEEAAAEPAADAPGAEDEAAAEAAVDTDSGAASGSESVAPEGEAEPSEPDARSDSESDAAPEPTNETETETDASDSEPSEEKED